jgi:hypothetical protein
MEIIDNLNKKKSFRGWGSSSVLEHLLSIHKALCSMPSTLKNRNKGKIFEWWNGRGKRLDATWRP